MIIITVKGLVQGIGFRPFVAELAEQLHIDGWCRNTAGIVTILAKASAEPLNEFQRRLVAECPPGGQVESLTVEDLGEDSEKEAYDQITYEQEAFEQEAFEQEAFEQEDPARGDFGKRTERNSLMPPSGFHIIASEEGGRGLPRIPADLPTCSRCERELHDPANRRYRHPFISCVSCGPRYSIIRTLPYDREHITMDDFPMCPDCAREYGEKGNVRRHAQTIACHFCGPVLHFTSCSGETDSRLAGAEKGAMIFDNRDANEIAFERGVDLLRRGGILAVKDIGGYHLACLPGRLDTVRFLRSLKGREKKPFALMYPDAESVQKDCLLSDRERIELESPARPIVLVRRKAAIRDAVKQTAQFSLAGDGASEEVMEAVVGSSPDMGVMLPCNPLQIMLAEELGPLIMTSANASGQPMIIDNFRMKEWLNQALDRMKEDRSENLPVGIWSHERAILVPLDDSLVRIVRGRRQLVRRSRGYVPESIRLSGLSDPVLAMGGDLKATPAYGAEGQVIPSGQMGDLEDEDCNSAYEKELLRLQKLLRLKPGRIYGDMHPGYLSRELGIRLAEENHIPYIPIQHHMSHVASVIAEHNLQGDVIGCALDGTGYANDGSIWGGEFFLWKNSKMQRKAHLRTTVLPGGNAGAKNCESILYGFLAGQASDSSLQKETEQFIKETAYLSTEGYGLISQAVKLGINTVRSSSMGRLFDAASALLGICLYNDYEGEAPMELEYLAARTEEAVPLSMRTETENGILIGDSTDYLLQMLRALQEGHSTASIARGFIDGIADFIYDVVVWLKRESDTRQVALSGGTFLNRILSERVIDRLEAAGYSVYMNEQVPTGDGGIALGQIYLGDRASRDSESEDI